MNPAPPSSWHYVYMLRSHTGANYFGCTQNLKDRIRQHLNGEVFTTKKLLPVELVYYEAYTDKDSAYKREKSLKKFGSAWSNVRKRVGGAG